MAELSAMPDYTFYVEQTLAAGWIREQITLDQTNTDLVTLGSVPTGGTGTFITISVPSGQKVSIMGTQQIPRGADARTAHALRIKAANTLDVEISIDNSIRITKRRNSGAVTELARPFYADVKMIHKAATAGLEAVTPKTDLEWYRFKQGIEVLGTQTLKIDVQNLIAGDSIDADHVRFALDMDLWTFGY